MQRPHSFLRSPTVTTLKTSSFRSAQITTALSLFVGYSGYYICRSNLSVATPLLIQEFAGQGLNKEVMGEIASVGVAFYAIGKVVNGVLGDFIGGKRIFILGMVGSVLATLLFGLSSGLALFFAAWAANRLVQSMGWGGLIKTTSNWFSFQSYGKIMGFLSLSFLVGDIVAKLLLGYLMDLGVGWRSLFFLAAALLAAIAILELFFLRDSPQNRGFALPPVHPDNLFTDAEDGNRPGSLKELLLPYFKNTSFLLMLLLSFGLTALREAFNFWLPTYLFVSAKMTEGQASQLSALYPIFGMVSILSMGYLSDVLLKGKRGIIILVASGLIAGVLSLMAAGLAGSMLSLVFISLIGLFLLGPYSFLAGAMSLDAGGRKGAATAAGLVDAVGYVGGIVALWGTGWLAQHTDWSKAFMALAGMAAFTALIALAYYLTQERKPRNL